MAGPTTTTPTPEADPRRILVRGVNWLGDAVMTTPALARLRERFPAARITLLAPEKLTELWVKHPGVDSVVAFAPGEKPWTVARQLRGGRHDLALVLPNSPRSALEVWMARIPRRIGYARSWRNWFLTEALPPRPGRVAMRKRSIPEIRRLASEQDGGRACGPVKDPSPGADAAHQIHEYLHLAAALGASSVPVAPKLVVDESEKQAAAAALLAGFGRQEPGVAPKQWYGLNPSAAYGPAKCWPSEAFAAVARDVSARHSGAAWVIFGGAGDIELGNRIASQAGGRIVNMAGKTTLRQLMAMLAVCRVLLTNDSGPMHLAAALGTPVVVPFGSTSPELTGPGLPGDARHHLLRADAACSPCFRRECPIDFRCMERITTGQVFQSLEECL